jgi:hypothetical protein
MQIFHKAERNNTDLPGKWAARGNLFAQAQGEASVALNLLLELKEAEQQCLGRGRAPRDVDVNRDNAVAPTNNGIRVVVVATTVRATAVQ